MNITAETKTNDLWKATQDQRNRAKAFFGIGTIILSETMSEPLGAKAADFIRSTPPRHDQAARAAIDSHGVRIKGEKR